MGLPNTDAEGPSSNCCLTGGVRGNRKENLCVLGMVGTE